MVFIYANIYNRQLKEEEGEEEEEEEENKS